MICCRINVSYFYHGVLFQWDELCWLLDHDCLVWDLISQFFLFGSFLLSALPGSVSRP